MIKAQIIADSLNTHNGCRLTTFVTTSPRFILAELNTHKMLSKSTASCLTGDTVVTIEKPASVKKGLRCCQNMTLGDIVKKWFYGDANGRKMRDRLKKMHIRCLNEETGEFGITRILNCFIQGEQDVYQIELENGYILKCTENHRIYTDKGWTTLKNICIDNNFSHSFDRDIQFATNGFELSKEWLLSQKKEGKNLKSIASEFDLDFETLRSFAEDQKIYFIRMKIKNEDNSYRNPDWLKARLSERLFYTQIAEMCNTSVDRVKKHAKKLGIKGNQWIWSDAGQVWNNGKKYKQKESSLVKVREAANRRRKPDSYKKYKNIIQKKARFIDYNKPEILEKFSNKCQMTGETDNLEIHHIVPFWYDESLVFDKDNLIVLNQKAHKFIHRYNLDLEFMRYYQEGKDLSLFMKEYEGVKFKCYDIGKNGPKKQYLILKYSKIKNISYIGKQETFDIEVEGPYHNFIANGVVVHNSRAIKIEKMIDQVRDNPACPIEFGMNRSGMQATEKLSGEELEKAKKEFLDARFDAIYHAMKLNDMGVHKQVVNRLLEPWAWSTTIISGTDWGNFFNLRCHRDAQPEFRELALCMLNAYVSSKPKPLNDEYWHLPFCDLYIDKDLKEHEKIRISVARCARVSYKNFDGDIDPEKDYKLHDHLLKSGHMSPFEHVAYAMKDDKYSGNFKGFGQYRKMFHNENKSVFNPQELLEERNAEIY